MDQEQSSLNRERTTAGPPKYSTDPAAPPNRPRGYRDDTGSGEIHQDIHHTRSEMDETLAAIADALRPSKLVAQYLPSVVSGVFGGSGGGKSDDSDDARRYDASKEPSGRSGHSAGYRHNYDDSSNVSSMITSAVGSLGKSALLPAAAWTGKATLKFVKKHPIPAAIIGAGAAYAIYEASKSNDDYARSDDSDLYSGSYVDARTGRPYNPETYGREFRGASSSTSTAATTPRAAGTYGTATMTHPSSSNPATRPNPSEASSSSGSITDSAKATAAGAADATKDAASSAASGVAYAGEKTYDAAAAAGEYAYDAAATAGRYTKYGAQKAYYETKDTITDHPLTFALVGAGAALLVGYQLMSSQQKDAAKRRSRYARDRAYEEAYRARVGASRAASSVGPLRSRRRVGCETSSRRGRELRRRHRPLRRSLRRRDRVRSGPPHRLRRVLRRARHRRRGRDHLLHAA